MSSWKSLLPQIGENCPEYAGITNFKDHTYIVQCAEQFPHKIPLYGTVVGLLNLENEDFVRKVVENTQTTLQDALVAGNCNRIHITMRFLTVMMYSKVLQPISLVVVYETLLSSAAARVDEERGNPSWQACADFYITCILSCLPWGGAELVEQVPEEIERVMVGIEAYLRIRRHTSDIGFAIFEDVNYTEKALDEKGLRMESFMVYRILERSIECSSELKGPSMASMDSSFQLPANLKLLVSNLSAFVTVKLDVSNFIVWKNQLFNILRATGLLGYVNGSLVPPSEMITDKEGVSVLNPEFAHWHTVDAHLLSFWYNLEKRFTSLSRSHIHQLKNKLHNITKTSSSMEEYLAQIKDIADQLALAGSAVDDEDLVLLTLNGLPTEYGAFNTTIRAKTDPISMDVLSSLLCSEAIHIESTSKTSSSSHMAYSASNTASSQSRNSGSRTTYRTNFHRGERTDSRGGSAFNCWHRLDSSFQPSASSMPFHHSSDGSNKAYVASTSHPPENWYLDSAASSHITHDLQNLNMYQPYEGHDQVMVGDGVSLPIQHKAQLVAGKAHDLEAINCPEQPDPPAILSAITCGKQKQEAELKYPQRICRLNVFPANKTEDLQPIDRFVVEEYLLDVLLFLNGWVSNFQFIWPWEEWAYVLDLPKWAPQRVFVQEVLEREVRLSYWDKVKQSIENAPALEELLPPKGVPNFKYSGEDGGDGTEHALSVELSGMYGQVIARISILRNVVNKTYNRISDLRKEISLEGAEAKLTLVDGEPVLGENPVRLKRLKANAEKTKEAEVSFCESLEVKEALLARALEENEALFLSLFKNFSTVMMERIHDAFRDGTMRQSHQAEEMAIDLEDSSAMELDKENGKPKKSHSNGERANGYNVGEKEQWCLSTLGYVKAFSRQYASEIRPHIEKLDAEVFTENVHPLFRKAVYSGLNRPLNDLGSGQ
ncbi:unnamed protein product [Camellia sinensis]